MNENMLVGKLRSLWIIFRSMLTIVRYSCAAIVVGTFFKNPRPCFDKMSRNFSRCVLKHAKVHYEILLQQPLKFDPKRFYIIMSNHESHYDIPLLFLCFSRSIRMLTKKELFRIPLFGRAMTKNEFISIDRNSGEQALRDLERAKEKMKSGILLWVAPEGTRSRNGKIGPFKKGGFMVALQTGAIIIPVGIRGTYEILPPATWNFTLNQQAEVHIGQPIDASQFNLKQREELMQLVNRTIHQLAGQQH